MINFSMVDLVWKCRPDEKANGYVVHEKAQQIKMLHHISLYMATSGIEAEA